MILNEYYQYEQNTHREYVSTFFTHIGYFTQSRLSLAWNATARSWPVNRGRYAFNGDKPRVAATRASRFASSVMAWPARVSR